MFMATIRQGLAETMAARELNAKTSVLSQDVRVESGRAQNMGAERAALSPRMLIKFLYTCRHERACVYTSVQQ